MTRSVRRLLLCVRELTEVTFLAPSDTPVVPRFSRRTTSWLIAWGLVVWVAVAVTVRLIGHRLLSPETPVVLAVFFAATVPLMALVTYPIYRRFGIESGRRPRAAVMMSLPGMFLDVLLVSFAGIALPNLSVGAVINFGAILLFGYAVVLLTGFVPR